MKRALSLCCFSLTLLLTSCAGGPAVTTPATSIAELNAAARQALEMGDLDNARLILRDAYATESLNPDTLTLMLRLHTTTDDTGSMEAVALQILQHDQDNTQALETLGNLALRSDRLLIARDYLTRATHLNPGSWSAWNTLGIVADRDGQHEEAQTYYLRGLALIPGHPQILANLGWSLLLAGHYEAAEERLRASLDTMPDVATTRSNLALGIAMQGRYEEAQVLYRSLFSDAVAANNLGIAALQRGDREHALEFFRQAVNLSPTYYERAAENLRALQGSSPTPVVLIP